MKTRVRKKYCSHFNDEYDHTAHVFLEVKKSTKEELTESFEETKKEILRLLKCGDELGALKQLTKTYTSPEFQVDPDSELQHGGVAGNSGFTRVQYYAFFEQRPMIEALFFEDPDSFIQMLERIKKRSDKKALLQVVKQAMKATDLNYDALFTFTSDDAKRLKDRISSLRSACDDIEKTKCETFTETLKKLINLEFELKNKLEASSSKAVTSIDIGIIKAEFVQALHEHDDKFKQHRNPFFDNVIRNLVAFLFTGGIAFGINRAVNGQWLFGQKTKTQEKVDAVDKALSYCSAAR